MFYRSLIETPLGEMVAVADEARLYYLKFVDQADVEREIKELAMICDTVVEDGASAPIELVTTELRSYFNGELNEFKTPLHFVGTPFQRAAWHELTNIPYGVTCSYGQQAATVGNPNAFRAVGSANGANRLAIVVPCHRVVATGGKLGGYAGGLNRKQWLLNHEQKYKGVARGQ